MVAAYPGDGILSTRHVVCRETTTQEVSVKVALVMFKFNDTPRDRFNLKS